MDGSCGQNQHTLTVGGYVVAVLSTVRCGVVAVFTCFAVAEVSAWIRFGSWGLGWWSCLAFGELWSFWPLLVMGLGLVFGAIDGGFVGD